VRETVARSSLDPAWIDSAVMGNVIQAGNKMNPGRQAAIHGGLPVSVPAMTVNPVCGLGAQAIATAAQQIWLGQQQVAGAGGMENMDRAPYLMDGGRWGYRMGPAEIYDSMLRDGLEPPRWIQNSIAPSRRRATGWPPAGRHHRRQESPSPQAGRASTSSRLSEPGRLSHRF
jgi:acetyl-CoA acetyltransferase